MKSPSFHARFVAVLAMVAMITGDRNWSGARARKGLMSGPPMSMGFGGALTQTSGQQSSSQPGTVSNSGSVPGRHVFAPIPNLPGGSYYAYSQVELLSGLGAYTPPVSGMFLATVSVEGGAGPGGLKIVYATPNTAIFATSASTTGGTVGVYGCGKWETYPVSWILNGTNIPVGTFASVGAYFQAILTAQTIAPVGNPDISAYRAIGNYYASTAASTIAQTVTFDAQPGVIRGIVSFGCNTAGNATVGDNSAYLSYSAGGAYVQFVPVQGTPGPNLIHPMQPIPAANTATVSTVTVTITGTTTLSILIVSFY